MSNKMSFAHSGYVENPTVKMYYSEYVKSLNASAIFDGTILKKKCFVNKDVCVKEVTQSIYKISDQK